MRFIVTGAAGLIGSNVVAALNQRGHTDILAVDHINHPEKERNLSEVSTADYMDKAAFRSAFLDASLPAPEAVFHLGACSSTTETDEDYLQDNNFLYTRQLCEWCLLNETRFIYASSAATYGDGAHGYSDSHELIPKLQPMNLYGESKQRFDLWALRAGVLDRIVGLKYFNVYGPGENHKGAMRSVVNKAHREILETGQISLFRSHRPGVEDGMQDRDFIYVNDAAAVTLFFLDHRAVSGVFNCGTGHPRTWLDLAHALFSAMDRPPQIRFTDMPAAIRDTYQYHTSADMTKLHTAGYATPFTSLEDGIAAYVREHLTPRANEPAARRDVMTTRATLRATRVGLLATLLLAGCSTTKHPARLEVDMTRDGGAVIEGRAFGPRQVATGLRQAGAGPATRIEVTLPAGTDEATITAFARTVSTAGYRLVHFRTGKRAAAFVE